MLEFCQQIPEYLSNNYDQREATLNEVLQRFRREVRTRVELDNLLNILGPAFTADELGALEAEGAASITGHTTTQQSERHQDFTKFPVYVTQSLMSRLQACPDDYSAAIQLVLWLTKLGLRSPSETTIQAITSYPKDRIRLNLLPGVIYSPLPV